MSLSVYTTNQLLLVVDSLENKPQPFIRDRYFTREVQSEQEVILFDVIDKKRRLAPYVSPVVKGKVMEALGYSTRMFKPAYLKPKAVVRPTDAIKRTAGEPIGGNLSIAQRRDIHIRTHLEAQDEAITMREEVQAVESLRLGQVTVSGDGYPTTVVSFGRDAALRATLSGTDLFSDAACQPFKIIQAKALLIRQKSGGAIATDVILGTDAFQAMLDRLTDAQLKALYESQSRATVGTTTIEIGPRSVKKWRFEGRIGDYDFYTYSETYVDEDGNEVDLFPADEMMLVAPDVEGVRAYGAILDADAPQGAQALRRFPKMWKEPDPSAEYVMTQAAPLMVPTRPNATGSWVVL